MSEVHEQLLRGLPPGGVMWLKAAGKSLWPLLRDGDSLRVERVTESQLRAGDVAVVKLPGGVLAAHLVVQLAPLQTASTTGILDALPVEALGRVTGFRRGARTFDWPAQSRLVLQYWPLAARALKRVPLARSVVRLLRD